MKTKLMLVLCLLSAHLAFAQQPAAEKEAKITITKKVKGADGTYSSETIVKKGQAARDFDMDKYIAENKADNTDLQIRYEGPDEERYVVINGNEGPKNMRARNINELEREVTEEVEKTFKWVDEQVKVNTRRSTENERSAKAYLGVEDNESDEQEKEGLTINVVEGGPADNAGLRNNDRILRINDTPVNRWSDLTQFLSSVQPDDKIQVRYLRDGKEATKEVTLGARYESKKKVIVTTSSPKGFLGVSPLGDDDDDTKGVKVNIVKKSAAEKAGMENGDIILELNGEKIEDFDDIEDFMEDVKPGDQIKIKLRRDGKEKTIEATAGEKQIWDWGQTDWQDNNIQIRTKEACLGIYNDDSADESRGVNIVSFAPGSGAAAAGLQIGDVILAIGDRIVEDAEDLWCALSQSKPAEKIRLQYQRGAEQHSVDVELKPCEDTFSMVTLTNSDEAGNGSERRFFTWNANEKDKENMRVSQVITIRKAEDGDAPVISTLQGNESNPIVLEKNLQVKAFSLSPNPSNGPLKLSFNAAPVPTKVTMYDLTGRQLFQEELNIFNGAYVQQFDLSELAKSAIILRIQQGDQVYAEQISIQ